MLYVVDIFFTPQTHIGKRNKYGKYTQTFAKEMTAIQRQVALLIMGVLSSAPTDAVKTMANLLPFNLLVDKIQHSMALQLTSLPPQHPLSKLVANAAS